MAYAKRDRQAHDEPKIIVCKMVPNLLDRTSRVMGINRERAKLEEENVDCRDPFAGLN